MELKKIAKGAVGSEGVSRGSNSAKQIYMRVWSDIVDAGYDMPESLQDLNKMIQRFPASVKNLNDGKGVPLSYEMAPISSITALFCESEIMEDQLFRSVDLDIASQRVGLFDEISRTRKQLESTFNTIMTHTSAVSQETVATICALRQTVVSAEWDIKDAIRNNKDLRSIRVLWENYLSSDANPSKVSKALESLRGEIEKIELVASLKAEGVLFLGRATSLSTILSSSKFRELYVLSFADEERIKEPQLWQDNLHFFKSLLQNPMSDQYLVGFVCVDNTHSVAFYDKRIMIVLYKDGKPLCGDVYAEWKDHDMTMTSLLRDNAYDLPKKQIQLRIQCPLGQCKSSAIPWNYTHCGSFLEYGFDNFLYCNCGKAPAASFLFRCRSARHGINFAPYPEIAMKRQMQMLQAFPELNILIVGHTGVGKSTWINAISNYLTFENLEDATNGQPLWPIPGSFFVCDDDLNEKQIFFGQRNETGEIETGQSVTQEPKAYTFELNNVSVRLIDTPGIGDSRGIEQDRKNIESTLRFLEKYEKLHGICVLLKPNDSIIDISFRYCVKEILTNLHKSATQNIAFCFTNARSTLYRPGNTLPILRKLLGKLTQAIQIDTKRVYCMDNEGFRFLATMKQGIDCSDEDIRNFSASWRKSRSETTRLIDHFLQVKPHELKDMATLNSTRRLIIALTRPLGDISKVIQINIAEQEAHEQKLSRLQKDSAEYKANLYIPVLKPVNTPLDYPSTVCIHSDCVDLHSVGGQTYSQYKTVCHSPCFLSDIKPESFPEPDLKNCTAMDAKFSCAKCHHLWDKHMHVRYSQKLEHVKVVDQTTRQLLAKTTTDCANASTLIRELQELVKSNRCEQEVVMKVSAKFGQYLKRNAITPYNDGLGDYLDYYINEQRAKPLRTDADNVALEYLIQAREQYRIEVEVLEKALNAGTDEETETPEQLQQKLFALPINGASLREMVEASMGTQSRMFKHSPEQPLLPKKAKLPLSQIAKETATKVTTAVKAKATSLLNRMNPLHPSDLSDIGQ